MRIYLNTEMALRELSGNLLVATKAASRGHEVAVFDQRSLPVLRRWALKKPGIFHTKSLHPETSMVSILSRLASDGFPVTSVDQEHGLLWESYDMMLRERYSDETMSIASAVFTWGNWDYSALRKAFPSESNKIKLGGAARVDLWDERFSNASKSGIPAGPYILVSSNLAVNHVNRYWEIYSALRSSGVEGRSPGRQKKYLEAMSNGFILASEYVDLVRDLAHEFPDVTIVVRPHPNEDPAAWSTLLAGLSNVLVTRTGSISPWILNASAVIHNGCTSAIESSISGVPVVTFVPPGLEENSRENVANLLGETVTNSVEAKEVLQRFLNRSKPRSARNPEWLKERVFKGSKLAENSDILIREWELLMGDSESGFSAVDLIRLSLVAWFSFARISLRRKTSKLFAADKFPPLDFEQLRSDVKELELILGLETVSILPLSPTSFVVRPGKRTTPNSV